MKTFLLWILFVGLIWFSKAENVGKNNNAIKKEKDGLLSIPAVKGKTITKSTPKKLNFKVIAQKKLNTNKLSDRSQPSIQKSKTRRKRNTFRLPWRKDELTYSILIYSQDLPANVQERVFAKAFNLWQKAAPQLKFQFKRNDPNVDIKIAFVRGDHGDGKPFDGQGSIIGHVFYPEDGRMHFDEDEWFTDKSKYGVNLLTAAVHEIGHSLGLGHSKKKSSIMYKLYRKYTGKDVTLSSGDIKAVQWLYRFHPSSRMNPNCRDKDAKICKRFKNKGYCSPKYDDTTKQFCKFTCNLCNSYSW